LGWISPWPYDTNPAGNEPSRWELGLSHQSELGEANEEGPGKETSPGEQGRAWSEEACL